MVTTATAVSAGQELANITLEKVLHTDEEQLPPMLAVDDDDDDEEVSLQFLWHCCKFDCRGTSLSLRRHVSLLIVCSRACSRWSDLASAVAGGRSDAPRETAGRGRVPGTNSQRQ